MQNPILIIKHSRWGFAAFHLPDHTERSNKDGFHHENDGFHHETDGFRHENDG